MRILHKIKNLFVKSPEAKESKGKVHSEDSAEEQCKKYRRPKDMRFVGTVLEQKHRDMLDKISQSRLKRGLGRHASSKAVIISEGIEQIYRSEKTFFESSEAT